MDIKVRNNHLGVMGMLFLCSQAIAQVAVNNQAPGLSRYHLQHEPEVSMLSAVDTFSTAYETDWQTISTLLDASSSTYTETWDDITCRTLHEGAYLGNGDFGVHLGGTKHSLKYYLGKNGFHAGNDKTKERWTQHILNLAILTIEKSSGIDSGNIYSVTQDIKNAEIRTHCTMGGSAVQTKAYISDSGNDLILELSANSGKDVPIQATLSVIGNAYVAKKAGTLGDIGWVTKEPHAEGAPFYVKGAIVAKVLGAVTALTTNDSTFSKFGFTLPADGSIVKIFLSAEHTKNKPSPLSAVQATVQNINNKGITDIYKQHKAWWKNFWLQSYINLGDDVQKYWYNHLFMIGSCARSGRDNAPGKAPGHWGPWNRSDDMMWFSNVSMNYNGQNPYYGTFAANHVDLVDPYIETVKYYLENTGRKRVANRWVSPKIEARMPSNCRGVQFELSFTSHGTSCGGGSWVEEDGSMPTNAVFGILPIVWKWKYGQDSTFLADLCYPLMLEVANFYDDFIGEPVNGQYDVYGCVHEGADWFAANDMFSLGSVKFLYREIIAASIKLGRDADRRAHWQDILDNMSKYPLQEWGNTITFRPDQIHDVMEALTFHGGARNTGLIFTTTFDNTSFSTLPAYKIATCNTLKKGNMFYPQRFSGWRDSNDFGIMFVMAARAGYRPDLIMKGIKGWKPELNGIVSQRRGGGIETAGIVEAINNMLLQSHDGVIRIFPNWDRTIDAEFNRLRTVGAFLVRAKYDASEKLVNSVQIYSEKGNACTIQSPFKGSCINVIRADNQQHVLPIQNEEEFTFNTTAGITYNITRAACPSISKGSPVIMAQPGDTIITLPEKATFTVLAKGKQVKYQWQKNRVNIPNATASSYTTPATTMYDIGSEYRCVISNSSGKVYSEPGVLNPDSIKY